MHDSNGKMPDGLFEDTASMGNFFRQIGIPIVDDPNNTANWQRYNFPQGYVASLGNYWGCIETVAEPSGSEDFAWSAFTGKYFYVKMDEYVTSTGSGSKTYVPMPKLPRGGAYWMEDMLSGVGLFWNGFYVGTMGTQLGICVPSGCGIADVASNYEEVYSTSLEARLRTIMPPTTLEIEKESRMQETGQWAFAGVLGFIGLVMVAATGVDLYLRDQKSQRNISKSVPPSQSFPVKLLLCFSAYANVERLMRTSRSKDTIGCLDGMRFFSMTWVALGHCYVYIPQDWFGKINPKWVGRVRKVKMNFSDKIDKNLLSENDGHDERIHR